MAKDKIEARRPDWNDAAAGQDTQSRADILQLLAAQLGRGHPVSVIYSDLDNFKSVNDTLGHVAGDRCVEEFEKLLVEISEGKGKVCRRYATGDEFVVILPNFITPEAAAVAERIRSAVEQSRIGGEIPVTVSLGVHGSEIGPVAEAAKLLHLADQMMYQAKQTKNTVASPTISGKLLGPAELRRSLEEWMRESNSRWEAVARDRISGENRSLYYAWGAWSVAYAVAAVPLRLSLPELLEVLEKMPVQTRCLHPWRVPPSADKRPYPFERTLECWPTASLDGFSPEFWRASPDLKMFYLRKHEEDEFPGAGPVFPSSRRLVIGRPIWRIGECVLHAARLSRFLNLPPGPVAFQVKWTGLAGRRLASTADGMLDAEHECRQDSVESTVTASTADIEEKLSEITGALLAPLYEAFDLFRLEDRALRTEIASMLADCAKAD